VIRARSSPLANGAGRAESHGSGFIGAGLAGAAYVRGIWHLISAHCSAGLSRIAFAAWLAASLLVTAHAVAIKATVFIALGAIQLAATALILVYATKYEHSYCAIHLPRSLEREPEPASPHSLRVPAGGGGGQLDTAERGEQLHIPRTTRP
jgi:hypothetical protein